MSCVARNSHRKRLHPYLYLLFLLTEQMFLFSQETNSPCLPTSLQVLILSEKLHSVTSKFDHLRAIRFQEIINRTVPRKKFKRASVAKFSESSTSDGADFGEHDVTSASLKLQAQELDDETRALQVLLSSL